MLNLQLVREYKIQKYTVTVLEEPNSPNYHPPMAEAQRNKAKDLKLTKQERSNMQQIESKSMRRTKVR